MSRPSLLLGGLIVAAQLTAQEVVIPLQAGWSFHQVGDSLWLPADVPGTVHTDLMRNGRIPDSYRDNNVDSVQWIEDRAWEYRCIFNATDELLGREQVELLFKGLDTFAEVYLNGSLLGRADNMFRSWNFSVRSRLRTGANELHVVFRSAVREGEKLRTAFGFQLPADNDAGALKVSPYVRKAAYQFGWDFAPRLVTCGIWQPVMLRAWNSARIDGLRMGQVHALGAVIVSVDVDIATQTSGVGTLILDIDGQRSTVPVSLAGKRTAVRASLEVKDPRLWWPADEGERTLYPLRVELVMHGRVISTTERRIGLRTIRLVQAPDSIGRSFTFEVNGRPVFMQGCNLVPPDLFLPRAGDSTWVRLVRDMRRAHMNMVRVWGGGVYPPDAFLEACDTAGILVWQDLMFANMVPDDDHFIGSVKSEVLEQVRRMDPHPCLALWCGNNELAVAWENWGWQKTYGYTASDSTIAWEAYLRLFHRELPELVEATSSIPYVPTSPLSNWGDRKGLRHGDLHYWGVWHGDSAFASFGRNVGRFVSEHGFQSYPDSITLARSISGPELHLGSSVLGKRQRSYKTDAPILQGLEHELGLRPRTLQEFCSASQELQARALHEAIWAHRTAQPYCMGTLFWQLNDPWPGPSWSVIDHTGRWKEAMYEAQRSYAPVMLDLRARHGTIEVNVFTRRNDLDQAQVRVRLTGPDGVTYWDDRIPVSIDPGVSTLLRPAIRELQAKTGKTTALLSVAIIDGAGLLLSERSITLGPDGPSGEGH